MRTRERSFDRGSHAGRLLLVKLYEQRRGRQRANVAVAEQLCFISLAIRQDEGIRHQVAVEPAHVTERFDADVRRFVEFGISRVARRAHGSGSNAMTWHAGNRAAYPTA